MMMTFGLDQVLGGLKLVLRLQPVLLVESRGAAIPLPV
jgi:hypothetical protein